MKGLSAFRSSGSFPSLSPPPPVLPSSLPPSLSPSLCWGPLQETLVRSCEGETCCRYSNPIPPTSFLFALSLSRSLALALSLSRSLALSLSRSLLFSRSRVRSLLLKCMTSQNCLCLVLESALLQFMHAFFERTDAEPGLQGLHLPSHEPLK